MQRQWKSLRIKKEIKHLRSKGKKVHTNLLSAIFCASLSAKFVIVCSKKALGKKATVRNLIKRRVRAILDSLNIATKIWCMIILKTESKQATFSELKKSLAFCLHKAEQKITDS